MTRQWHIIVDASDGETYQITDTYLIGAFHALTHDVELAVERWESETHLEAEKIVLESHGRP